MNSPKSTTKVVDKTAKTAPEKVLSKHDAAAIDAANTNTTNDGSHIAKQREKLIANVPGAK